MPRSDSLRMPPAHISRLEGFKSRWITPFRCTTRMPISEGTVAIRYDTSGIRGGGEGVEEGVRTACKALDQVVGVGLNAFGRQRAVRRD